MKRNNPADNNETENFEERPKLIKKTKLGKKIALNSNGNKNTVIRGVNDRNNEIQTGIEMNNEQIKIAKDETTSLKRKEKDNSADFLLKTIMKAFYLSAWKKKIKSMKYYSRRYDPKRANFKKLINQISSVIKQHKDGYFSEIYENMKSLPLPDNIEHDYNFGKLRIVNKEFSDKNNTNKNLSWKEGNNNNKVDGAKPLLDQSTKQENEKKPIQEQINTNQNKGNQKGYADNLYYNKEKENINTNINKDSKNKKVLKPKVDNVKKYMRQYMDNFYYDQNNNVILNEEQNQGGVGQYEYQQINEINIPGNEIELAYNENNYYDDNNYPTNDYNDNYVDPNYDYEDIGNNTNDINNYNENDVNNYIENDINNYIENDANNYIENDANNYIENNGYNYIENDINNYDENDINNYEEAIYDENNYMVENDDNNYIYENDANNYIQNNDNNNDYIEEEDKYYINNNDNEYYENEENLKYYDENDNYDENNYDNNYYEDQYENTNNYNNNYKYNVFDTYSNSYYAKDIKKPKNYNYGQNKKNKSISNYYKKYSNSAYDIYENDFIEDNENQYENESQYYYGKPNQQVKVETKKIIYYVPNSTQKPNKVGNLSYKKNVNSNNYNYSQPKAKKLLTEHTRNRSYDNNNSKLQSKYQNYETNVNNNKIRNATSVYMIYKRMFPRKYNNHSFYISKK